jgi:hypothetical protein
MSNGAGALAKLFVYGAIGLAFNNPLWTDENGAVQTLHDARPDLKVKAIGGYSWFNSSDSYKTKFEAIGPDGNEVDGVVTEGLIFKGSTIRYLP